jgi:hypothetical protein
MNPHRSSKWRRFSRARAKFERKRRDRFRKYLKQKHLGAPTEVFRASRGPRKRAVKRHRLEVPKHLSLLKNFQQTNDFLVNLRRLLSDRKKLFVDFSGTNDLTVEAVLIFLAILREKAGRRRAGRVAAAVGNSPIQGSLAGKLLLESGFYEHVSSDVDLGTATGRGTIRPRVGKRVNATLANTLTEKAAMAIFRDDRRLPAVYRTLIEVMGNTKQHAGLGRSEEQWWAMVHTDPDARRAEFAFYDNGVGIVGSFRTRWQNFLAQLVGAAPSQEDILENLLKGEFPSRTNLPFRGKGLPAIAKALARRQIENLTIITNRVVADVSRGTVAGLTSEFQGTLIYWEVGKKNDNYKNQRF